jgi:predicted house-cleaning noncanonical NTP pyrophosphatase (MazG superfamily)
MREKLVRDRVPELFGFPSTSVRVAAKDELDALLAAKLVEEAHEYLESRDLEELVDVLEVLAAIEATRGIEPATLEHLRIQKKSERGAFGSRLVWAIPPELDEPWAVTNHEGDR